MNHTKSILILTLFIVGCASTGPVPMGQNHYSISKTSAACGFRDAGGVRADIYEEMYSYCQSKNLEPEVISIEALDGVIGVRCASATIEFRCVTQSSENLAPTGQSPYRDMNRNPHIPSDRGEFGPKPQQTAASNPNNDQRNGDIYSDLKKLKELLDEKIITQQEFDTRKQKLLAAE